MLTIKRYFSDNNHYVDLFGFSANAFIRSIDWLWHIDSEEFEVLQYSLSDFTTPDVMSCVYAFIEASLTESAQSTINDCITLLRKEDSFHDSIFGTNTVSHTKKDNVEYITYKTMNKFFVCDVIWIAYMFCSLNDSVDEKYKRAEKMFYEILFQQSCLKKTAFEKSFFLMKHKTMTTKTYLSEVSLMKKQQKEKDAAEEKRQNEISQKLCEYRDHPIYGLGYDSVVSFFANQSIGNGSKFTNEDYLNVFLKAEECVNMVLKSKMPEIEITRLQSHLKDLNAKDTFMNCIIEMIFLIAVYDLLPEKTERVMKSLTKYRTFIEHKDISYIYKNDVMWQLIAERIPSLPNSLTEADLKVEVSKLKNELAKFQNGDASTEWHEMTMDVIAVFDQTMNPVGFYEIPKIKELSKLGQCKFVIRLLTSQIPYAVALLHTISFMDYLAKQQGYESQESRLRIIEKALKLSPNNRSLKGNFNVLKPDSNEDKSKYTACTLLDEAESFYNSLPLIPN